MKNCLFIFWVCVIVGGVLIGWKKGEVMKGTCGDNLEWELRDSVLTISGSGEMDDDCFSSYLSVRKVIIKEGVTSIGKFVFWGCEKLTSVIIPNSVISIGNKAFSDCYNLSSITIPNSVTNIGNSAFFGCENLTSIIIPNSVTSIGDNAFYGVSNIEYHGNAKGSPWGAKSINGYVEGDLIYNDRTKIILRACFRTAKGKIVIPNSVTSIGRRAFEGCLSLTSITIPNSVTSIGGSAFENCENLTSVIIPNSVTSIGGSAFAYCVNLTSVIIPNSVTSIGGMAFSDVSNIEYHGPADGAPWGALSVNGYIEENLVYNDHTKIFLRACFRTAKGKIVIPNSVTSIGNSAFSRCENLTSVVIPNSVTSIGDWAFMDCENLTSVVIPNSVTSIGWSAFAYCVNLTSVIIPNSVTSIGGSAFAYCVNLTSVIIPNSVTSIGGSAFQDVPNIEYHGNAYGSPWGAKSINGYVEGDLVYSDHTKKTLRACNRSTKGKIVIPNSVTSIGYRAFEGCLSLTSVTIPNSVTSIGKGAFAYCVNLTSVIIPNSVTSIGYRAFESCLSLTSVTIPNSVTSIGKRAFSSVSNIEYHGSADGAPWGARRLNGVTIKK